MGTIHIDVFSTLDGVAQAPGGPQEDPEGGFTFGGWQAPISDEVVGKQVIEEIQSIDALLLGRKTYDIFASYWPYQDNDIATVFNAVPKYVASRHPITLEWANSTLLGADLSGEIRALRDRHEHTHVFGSLNFVQTLLSERLFDQLRLWVYPILLGEGKHVFAGGVVPSILTLLEPPVTARKGAVLLRYGLVEGVPATAQMS